MIVRMRCAGGKIKTSHPSSHMARVIECAKWLGIAQVCEGSGMVTDLYFMAIHGRGAIFNSSSSSVLLRKLNFVFKISSNTLPSVVSIILGFFACL